MAQESRFAQLRRPRTLLTALGLLVGIAACAWGALTLRGPAPQAPRNYTLVNPTYDTLTATVNAAGRIQPIRTAGLTFAGVGRVADIRVAIGDQVAAGALLAQLDDRDLQLRVAQAEAQLKQAQAGYDRLLAGPAAADIAAAEVQFRQAEAQLQQVRGSVTAADLRAAQEQVRQAQARLTRLLGNPGDLDVQTADARIREAEITLERQRSQLSSAKNSAAVQLEQAVNSLTQAQARYATARRNWEYARDTGNDPIVPRVADPTRPGASRPNRLTDGQQQQYYDAFVQAEAALRNAEEGVTQAQLNYDNARVAEATGIELAEGQLVVAQSQRLQLFAPADTDQVAAARAQLESARAQLDRLGGDQRAGALAAAEAGLAAAQVNLDRLRADPRAADLAQAEAQIQSARAALASANLALEETTMRAPFAGIVAEINLKEGEAPTPARPAIVIADFSSYIVDVSVDEIDVSRLAIDQPATLVLDALPELSLSGRVESIAPLASEQSAVASYIVRLVISAADQRVRAGMSVGADIVVAQVEQALIVPRRAVSNDRGRLVVQVVDDPALCSQAAEQRPLDPPRSPRDVAVGLRNEQLIEIRSGLAPSDCVYVEGVDQRFTLFGGPPPGVRR
ncbi:MAG TPA: efflux RND transporter periplasmic adaptor subunit [Roseiflexaceae bacterium]|nr:efflux RND transporter periplasmic adaptor subunit [Roseiflexaceae bacterium]HMP39679.1 efflux RND transporter periplasmic adaptor subunit [Roseiflexaceae bacterium]